MRSTLWDDYKKCVDRRIAKSPDDHMLGEAVREIDRASHLDFGEQVIADEAATRGPHDPMSMFLPFQTVALTARICLRGSLLDADDSFRDAECLLLIESNKDGNGLDLMKPSEAMLAIELPGSDKLTIFKFLVRLADGLITGIGRDSYEAHLFSQCTYSKRNGKTVAAHLTPFAGVPDKLIEQWSQTAAVLSTQMLRLVEVANSPANWIVQVTDEKARPVKRRGKRTNEKRTRYIVVPDRDLDRVLRLPGNGEASKKRGHRRRAHYRRLTAERYRLRRGERVMVRESWIGPKKASYGGETYRVLTHLPSSEPKATQR